MTKTTFKQSITGSKPLQNLSVYLKALWHDAKGNWAKAHTLIKDLENKDAA